MFILYAESYSSIRTYALKHDEPVQPNRDLFALGAANLVAEEACNPLGGLQRHIAGKAIGDHHISRA